MKLMFISALCGRVQRSSWGGWEQEQSSLVAHTPLSILLLHKRANTGWHRPSFSSGRDEPLSAPISCCFSSPDHHSGDDSGQRPRHQSCCDIQLEMPPDFSVPPEVLVLLSGPSGTGMDDPGGSVIPWLFAHWAVRSCWRSCCGSQSGAQRPTCPFGISRVTLPLQGEGIPTPSQFGGRIRSGFSLHTWVCGDRQNLRHGVLLKSHAPRSGCFLEGFF